MAAVSASRSQGQNHVAQARSTDLVSLSDSSLAGFAGLSSELAPKRLVLDF